MLGRLTYALTLNIFLPLIPDSGVLIYSSSAPTVATPTLATPTLAPPPAGPSSLLPLPLNPADPASSEASHTITLYGLSAADGPTATLTSAVDSAVSSADMSVDVSSVISGVTATEAAYVDSVTSNATSTIGDIAAIYAQVRGH